MPPANRLLYLRQLGRRDYGETWQAMRRYTETRTAHSRDELWLLEHPPIFTLGQAGRREHVLDAGPIPVHQTDRGGQVTYHGPGQLIAYLLLDLRRAGLGVRRLVHLLEAAVIALLAEHGIPAVARPDAPGVYVHGAKIAALGLRVSQGCSYHGLALNLDLDLAPFSRIDPCGHAGLAVTRLVDLAPGLATAEVPSRLAAAIAAQLSRELSWGSGSKSQSIRTDSGWVRSSE